VSHLFFLKLKNRSRDARDGLIAACNKYLTDHPGTIHFSAGVRADAYTREVNDKSFDVALVLVFECQAAHDRYQEAPRHKAFIAEQSANWAQVRVFDALV
jgi:hypothetical protein